MMGIKNIDARPATRHAYRVRSGLLLVVCAALAPHASAQESDTKLEVEVTGFRNTVGRVGVSLFKSANGFPSERSAAQARQGGPIKGTKFTTTFSGLSPGRYAVAVVHDENENQKLDKNLLGMPKEGWGVSNNVRPSLRAPKFEEAVFTLSAAGGKVRIQIGY
jgi:uncharacterized protein (DUF2141 family)